jgi:hypothetical protein
MIIPQGKVYFTLSNRLKLVRNSHPQSLPKPDPLLQKYILISSSLAN